MLRERGIVAMTAQDEGLFESLVTGVTVTVEASDAAGAGPALVLASHPSRLPVA